MLHTLFTQEHNYICDLLAHEHPDWTDEQLFAQGAADQLRADGQDPHRRVDAGDRAAPDHQAGDERELVRAGRRGSAGRARSSSTTRKCSAASSARTPTTTRAPYSLTEEFVAVYRMHPLIPDELAFRSLVTGAAARDARARRDRRPQARRAIAERHHDAGPVLLVRHLPSRRRSRCTTTRGTCRT